MMPNLAPVGYSGSSESLSRASSSFIGVDSTASFTPRPFEVLLVIDGEREGEAGLAFSTSVREVFWLDFSPAGMGEALLELLAALERDSVGNFMMNVGKRY